MKLKGISPLEQNVEHIVLVTVSGIFLVVVATQFLLTTNKVKVGSQDLPPGKAFEPAAEQAARLSAEMKRAEVTLPEIPPVAVADQFRQKLQGSVAPTAALAQGFGEPMKLEGVIDAPSSLTARELAMVPVPAPAQTTAYAYRFTVDPTEPVMIPELKPLLPAQQPLDKAAVSVEATIDGAAMRTALQQGGDKALPASWWGPDRTAVLAVRLEREEMVEPGQWSNLTEIAPLPGRTDGVAMTAKMTPDAMVMGDLVAQIAAGAQEDVLRPAFYRTIAGTEWLPPSEALAKVPVDEREVTAEVNRLRDIRRTLDRQRQQLADAGAPAEPRDRPAPGGGGGGGKQGAGGGGGGVQAPQPRQGATPANQAKIKSLQNAIAVTEKKEQESLEKLASMGRDENGNPIVKEAAPQQPGNEQKQVRLFEDKAIQVWSHDLTAEPGKSYRYRVKFAINNPAYGRAAALVETQKDLAAQPVIWSEPSDWSAPVAVPADRYYFITSASEANQLGAARVSAEVYQFFYGYYRKATVGMEPGDTLVAQVKLPDANKLLIYDVSVPKNGQQPQPQLPPMNPREPQGPGGKGLPQPVLPGEGGGVEGGNPEQAVVVVPENAKPWDKPIITTEDVILLDVARVPGEAAMVALLRGKDGTILKQSPQKDPVGIHKLVEESAKRGESQGAPVLRPAEERKPLQPIQPGQPTPRPERPAPGGGGGGGGGGS